MKIIRAASLGNLLFFIPVIVLSYFLWNDYKEYIDEYQPSFERVYMLDGGKQLIGLAKHPIGDELWIAYDEGTREAMIINYSSK